MGDASFLPNRGPPGPLMFSFMFLSPLGERLGEGVQRESCLLHPPLTQPLPQGGGEREENRERAWRPAVRQGGAVQR
jgi:hypothetical protein